MSMGGSRGFLSSAADVLGMSVSACDEVSWWSV